MGDRKTYDVSEDHFSSLVTERYPDAKQTTDEGFSVFKDGESTVAKYNHNEQSGWIKEAGLVSASSILKEELGMPQQRKAAGIEDAWYEAITSRLGEDFVQQTRENLSEAVAIAIREPYNQVTKALTEAGLTDDALWKAQTSFVESVVGDVAGFLADNLEVIEM